MKKLFGLVLSVAMIGLSISSTLAGETTGAVDTGANTGAEGTVITAPSASPVAGTYSSAQSVTLSAEGAPYVCYTVDGSTPDCDWDALACVAGSTKYTSAISVAATATINTLSCYQSDEKSAVSSFTYTISGSSSSSSSGGSSSGGGGGGGGGGSSGGVSSSICGNGIIESPENCDDSNTTDGDGCSAICEVEIELQSTTNIADPFTDIDGHWAEDFINTLRLMGVVHGLGDGTFGPDSSLTRAELVKIVVILFDIPLLEEVDERPFPDVELDEWFTIYIASAKAEGVVHGYDEGVFRPNRKISRVETLKVLLEASGMEIVGGEMKFADTTPGAWYEKYLAFGQLHKIINGYSEFVSVSSSPFSQDLKFGDSSDEVKKLQELLTKISYYDGQNTGYFGNYTQSWVKKFQSAYGLDPSGVVGETTATKIAELTGTGGTSEINIFRPEQGVTRGEVSKMAVLTFEMLSE